MEHYDQEKAARVWQRVRGEEPREGLPLPAAEEQLAGLYRSLGRLVPGPVPGQLEQECNNHASTVRGIWSLVGTPRPPMKQAEVTKTTAPALLGTCYSRTLRAIGEYERFSDHPEYGCAFRILAEQKRQQACRLLGLLGSLKQGSGNPPRSRT